MFFAIIRVICEGKSGLSGCFAARSSRTGWLAPLSFAPYLISLHLAAEHTHTLGKAFVRNYPGRPVSLCLPDMLLPPTTSSPPVPPATSYPPPPAVLSHPPTHYNSSPTTPSPLASPHHRSPIHLPSAYLLLSHFPSHFRRRRRFLAISSLGHLHFSSTYSLHPLTFSFIAPLHQQLPLLSLTPAVECRARLCHNRYPPRCCRRQPDSTPASPRCYSPKSVFKLMFPVPPPNAKSLSPNKKSSGSP